MIAWANSGLGTPQALSRLARRKSRGRSARFERTAPRGVRAIPRSAAIEKLKPTVYRGGTPTLRV